MMMTTTTMMMTNISLKSILVLVLTRVVTAIQPASCPWFGSRLIGPKAVTFGYTSSKSFTFSSTRQDKMMKSLSFKPEEVMIVD
jgi:hypothetical protein